MTVKILAGDCREVLATLAAESVQCVVTSPPYFGLRDYGVAGQLGLEPSPQEYVDQLVAVFREVKRVLRQDGTLWLNIGDSYAGSIKGSFKSDDAWQKYSDASYENGNTLGQRARTAYSRSSMTPPGLKPKDLLLIPARVALALQADGWWIRSEIIWSKAAPMPESVRDRPTCAHEKLWLLTKAASYYYDADAVREPAAESVIARAAYKVGGTKAPKERNDGGRAQERSYADYADGRNLRNVWHLNPEPSGVSAHFATMPPTLAERCIKAGSRPGDTILDPFVGAGTTLLVADRLQRHGIGIELNPEYIALAERRLVEDAGPMFLDIARAPLPEQL